MSPEEVVTPQNPELRLRKESSSPGEKGSPQVGLEGGKERGDIPHPYGAT